MIDTFKVYFGDVVTRGRLKSSYQSVFSTPEGKRVLRHIMKRGFLFDTTFVKGDPEATALNEGSRRLALGILKYAELTERQIIEEQQHVYDQTITP